MSTRSHVYIKVYRIVPALSSHVQSIGSEIATPPALNATIMRELFTWITAALRSLLSSSITYAHQPVFLPSLALSLLYLTVLSFNGQMIAYLSSVGITSRAIGLLRTCSTAVEISATWLAPIAMRKIGPLRAGLWSINWQVACVLGAISVFSTLTQPNLRVYMLVACVILSRVGLWGFDLCVQIIIQEVQIQL